MPFPGIFVVFIFCSLCFSTLDRILQTNQSSNIIADEWLGQPDLMGSNTPTPSTSRHILHADSGNILLRGDTLDRNPGFINPHEIQSGSWTNENSYAVNGQVRGRSLMTSRNYLTSIYNLFVHTKNVLC